MKFLILFFLNFNFIFSDIVWFDDFSKAQIQSKKENKVLLVFFQASWCSYCKKLEKTIFPDEEVSKELDKMILLKIDGDKNPELIQKYEVKAYPTLLFFDLNGNMIEQIIGSPSKDLILTKLEEAISKKDLESNLLEAKNKSPKKVLPNYNLGIFYFKNQNFKKSEEVFRNIAGLEDEDPIEQKSESIYLLGISLIQQEKYRESNQIFQFYNQKYPNSKLDKIYYLIGVCYFRSGKHTEAKENLLKAKENARSKEQLNRINEFLEIL